MSFKFALTDDSNCLLYPNNLKDERWQGQDVPFISSIGIVVVVCPFVFAIFVFILVRPGCPLISESMVLVKVDYGCILFLF